MDPFSIWIIGPSAVGKTTISKIYYNQLKLTNDKLRALGAKLMNQLNEIESMKENMPNTVIPEMPALEQYRTYEYYENFII